MIERGIGPKDIARVKLFGRLKKQTLTELMRLGKIRVLQPHSTLYRANTANATLYIVLRGTLVVSYQLGDRDVAIEIIQEGAVWGYTTLIHPGKKYPYHVHAQEHVVEVIELPVSKVIRLITNQKENHADILLELAKLQSERSRSRQKKLALMTGVAQLVHAGDDSRLLKNILELIAFALEAERALIASFDDMTRQIVIEEIHNYETHIAEARYALTADTLLSLVYNTNASLGVSKKSFERKFGSAPYARPSMMIAPLRTQGVVTGAVLCADKKGEGDFTADDSIVLDATAPLIASAIALRREKQLQKNTERLQQKYILP